MDNYHGELLVNIARRAITEFVKEGKKLKPKGYPREFDQPGGVFTTLHMYPAKALRGCIGYPEPIKPLIEALVESATAVTRDPRFPPLAEAELDRTIVEVSVLTKPVLIRVRHAREYASHIDLGKDGLIIERGPFRGLLLPQVPVEWKWDKEQFLGHLCQKASLPPHQWLQGDVKLYKFQTEMFAEEKPGGPVRRVEADDAGKAPEHDHSG